MEGLTPGHLLVLVAVVLLLFGARRLPEAARAIGRSARILRAEVRELGDDAGAGPPDP